MTLLDRILLVVAAAGMPLFAATTALFEGAGVEARLPEPPGMSAPPPGPRPPATSATRGPVPETIRALRSRGVKVTSLGAHGNLEGWFVELGPENSYSLYTAPGGYSVAGLLYGPDGVLVTRDQIASAAPRPPASRPTEPPGADSDLLARAENAAGFTLGDAGPHVVIFADAACPWSRSATASLAARALQGTLRLRVIPVGVLGERSRQRAMSILAHARPDLAWFGDGQASPTAAARELLNANNTAFDGWGENFVPLVAWRTSAGEIRRRTGEIADIDAWLTELAR